ncbi:Mitochondrial ornithine transporter 1 [Pseudozyma hubeiensis]|nr:Mitochondrial ornithine transporter 1 [Pseudozyma hubeiensis]
MIKSTELDPSPVAAAGLGVAGLNLDFGASTSSLASPSIGTTKAPRWGTIRQRFSSIQSRDSASHPEDSIDDGMWDKNDAAFLQEVARDSPLLLESPVISNIDGSASRTSLSSPRPDSFMHTIDAASAFSTPLASHDPLPPQSAFPSSSARPWTRSMRKTPSTTVLPDLPEQRRIDDALVYSRPSTSSSTLASTAPPFVSSRASSTSFVGANGFGNAHVRQSTGGSYSAHSSVGSSPMLTPNFHAGSDSPRSAGMQDQYPRSPSLHSSSSFPASGFVFRSFDDRTTSPRARQRTSSSNSTAGFNAAIGSAWTPSLSTFDRRTSRAQAGSPLAPAISSSSSRISSPEMFGENQFATASPILAQMTAENDTATSDRNRHSIAHVVDSPMIASTAVHATHSTTSSAQEPHSHGIETAVGTATTPATDAEVPSTASSSLPRKHAKNRSSLVSGLRKLMNKRERDSKVYVAANNASLPPPLPFPSADTESQSSTNDAHSRGAGLNLPGLAAGSVESDATAGSSHIASEAPLDASPRMARKSPSLDLLRGFASPNRNSRIVASASDRARPIVPNAPPSPRSRAKSIDGGRRPLRDVLALRSATNQRNRNSVIEHISHEQARRLTGNAGPLFLSTEQAIKEHRALYANAPAPVGLPNRSEFDMLDDASSSDKATHSIPVHPHLHRVENDQADLPDVEGVEMLATLSNSSSVAGMASGESAAYDTAATSRAPFGFQSQMYRPYSRESRESTPHSSSASFGRPATGDAAVSFPTSHRPALSLGSQTTLGSIHDGQTSDASSSGLSIHMPPPAGGTSSRRGHASRRSLNSLVGHRPWSSFLGSPVLSGSNSSQSHSGKRVSAAVISRPLSVTSSTFSGRFQDGVFNDNEQLDAADAADVTLRASDFHRTAAAARARADHLDRLQGGSRLRLDSDSSEPASQAAAVGATKFTENSTHGHSSWHFPRPPSGPLPHHLALSPPLQVVSTSSGSSHRSHQSHPHSHSQHSHQSYHSFSNSGASTTTAPPSASVSDNNLVSAAAPPVVSGPLRPPKSAARQNSSRSLRRPATGDGSTSPHLANIGSFQSIGLSAPSISSPLIQSSSLENLQERRFTAGQPTSSATALGFATAPRPSGAGHRLTVSGSSVSRRKRPSFGLTIEPAAHSAFDSIPSPLLHTRRISSALPEVVPCPRPFSSSSASAARTTPYGSSSGTSPTGSARASAATLSSSHHFDHEHGVEIETLLEGSPIKQRYSVTDPLSASVPALQDAMAAVSFREPASNHRHEASVPMDEGDSPRQHLEESWSRVTEGSELMYGERPVDVSEDASRRYMIHSPNEEEGPALATASATSSSGRLSQASKDIAFGSIAGMVSKVFEHPFDLVKVRLQTQSADRPRRYAGAFDCFKQTYLQEGIRGLYRGLSMPVIGATMENACLFFTYNQIQSAIRWANGEERSGRSAAKEDAEKPLSIPQLAIAAAGAGMVTSVVLTPIELIKCKMQVQMITREQQAPSVAAAAERSGPVQAALQQSRSIHTSALRNAAASTSSRSQAIKTLDGPLALLRRTIATDGIRGLWLGQTGTLLRETGGGVAWFLAFESCSRYLISRKKLLQKRDDITKKDLSSLELVGAGALAGISYNVVLFPADSVKSTMQTEQEMRAVNRVQGEKWKGTGFFETFKNIYRTRGVRGLYAGCGVTCLRSAPSSAIIFLMYNKLERLSDEYGL